MEASLERGQAFEELIRTKGWGFVKAWYQAKIQQFASSLLIEGNKNIEEFEKERRELMGIRALLGWIENDIKTLEDKIENDKKTRPITAKRK